MTGVRRFAQWGLWFGGALVLLAAVLIGIDVLMRKLLARSIGGADELAGYDGVLLSPGPGDPEPLAAEIETVQQLLGRTHVLGICLGHQLIARATGHDTYKLPFGHRGANHPVHEQLTGRVLVTSQNHGFAVSPSEAADVSHVSLYDGTVEGLDLPRLRARSLQFHPEAGPGPHDAWPLLEAWVKEVADAAA